MGFYILIFMCCPCLIFCETTLTFEEAVSKTLCLSPKLRIASSEVDEKIGLHVQSQLYPNPIAAYTVEDVLGNHNWKGWESAESRYEIAQLIELGGKRGYRSKIALYQFYAAQAGYEAQKSLVLNRLMKSFATVYASQENLRLSFERLKLAEEVSRTISTRVEEGKISLIHKRKADVELSIARINLEKARGDLLIHKEKLSSLWGSSCPDFDYVTFPFYEIKSPESIDYCICNNPELIKSQMEYFASQQNLKFECSLNIPDVVVTVGYKTLQENGNKGMILGATIPLPVFNRNQGNIQAARAEITKTNDRQRQLELLLENRLSAAHRDIVRAYNEVNLIRSMVLNTADHSFELAQEGYREGKFEYSELLDCQNTFFGIRERYIQAVLNYHLSLADIEYLNTQES